MIEEILSAKSAEAAISRIALKLGVGESDLKCEQLEEAKKGFLGIGSQDAKYKVTYIGTKKLDHVTEDPKPEQKPQREQKPQKAEKAERPAPAVKEQKPQKETVAQERPAAKERGNVDGVLSFIDMVLSDMKIDASSKLTGEEEEDIYIEIVGKDLGAIIGHHGEVLDSIQYLANIINDNDKGPDKRIHVDVENYRSKREDALNKLADRMAAKVLKNGRSVTLEPMNPYERRIIHSRIQTIEGVTTRSVGTDLGRKVVIYPEKGNVRNDKYQVERPEYSKADGCNDRYTAPGDGR